MTYSVKEIFYTLQGEGAQAGRPAVFCRFAGCNLWSGREQDRSEAVCDFCDTDFIGTDGINGGKFATAELLAKAIMQQWPDADKRHAVPYVVFTGGEPLLQLDNALIYQMHLIGFEVAVETNGTVEPPQGIDWLCVSPKADAEVVVKEGDELKLVYPQLKTSPEKFTELNFTHFYLQPMDTSAVDNSHLDDQHQDQTAACVKYCKEHPQWKLSLQTHKLLGIP